MFSRVYSLYKKECMEITYCESHPLLPYHNAHIVLKKMEYSHGTNFNRNAAILLNCGLKCKIIHYTKNIFKKCPHKPDHLKSKLKSIVQELNQLLNDIKFIPNIF